MKWMAMMCLFVMTGTACAQTMKSEAFQSVYSAKDVALDTHPEAHFWQEAKPVYIEFDRDGKALPHYRSEVRSRWTKDNLYLLFICPYQELNLKPSPDTVQETNLLWDWDVAEIFIGSDFQNIKRYKEFEVSPQGEWVDLDIDRTVPHPESGWTWNSGMKVAARIDPAKHVWYGVMQIPFKSIAGQSIAERGPAVGDTFRANLFRCQEPSDRRQYITWRPPMTETFHTPERFGELKLVAGK